MAQSAFTPKRPAAPLVTPSVDENYNLMGLNLRDPDAIMAAGETPYTINSRMYARDDGESRVANRTRKGAAHLSEPVGATANVSNVAGATGDVTITNTVIVGEPFTPNATACLTRLDLELKKVAGSTGHIVVEIYTDKSGVPGTLLAQGSVLNNALTTSYAYYKFYFIDAPTLTSGTQYWIVAYVQDNGFGPYYLHKTAASGALSLTFTNGAVSSSTALGYTFRYKTYLSTSGPVLGYTLRYPSTGSNLIVFAQKGSIFSTPKSTGTITSVDSGLDANAYVRFAQVDDKTIWCNGVNHARWWDGTTVADMPGVPSTTPSNVIIWKNRAFFMTATNRVDFSDLGNYTSFTSTNFFYVPNPKSPDHMTGWVVFQDNLVIFLHETKHTILGNDISTFTRKEAVGTKGAVSQEAIASDRNFVYFMADDRQIYKWNGATDQIISDLVQPELSGIVDVTQVRLELHNNQLRVYYPKAPSSFANQMLLYDIVLQQWFMDTGHPAVGCTTLYLDDQELIEFSSLVGRVYYGENQFSDLGKMLDWKYWTNYKSYAYRRRTGQTFGGGSAKKRIKRFHPVLRTQDADYTMLVGKDMDFANNPDMREYIVSGGGAQWGQFVWADGTKWGKSEQVDNLAGMSGRGKHIQYRFERKGIETPVELYGYIAQYKVGRQK